MLDVTSQDGSHFARAGGEAATIFAGCVEEAKGEQETSDAHKTTTDNEVPGSVVLSVACCQPCEQERNPEK
jgi:hypothetical protein